MNLTLVWKVTLILSAAAAATGLLRRGSAAQRHLVWMLGFAALLALPFVPELSLPQTGALAAVVATGAPTIPWLHWLWLSGAAVALVRLLAAHVRMSNAVDAPAAMTWGILRPRILGPSDGLHQLDRRHEEAHIARRDGLWQLIAQLACAAYWFHPLIWWAERRASQECERACDDLVLRSGANPTDYAQRLVDAARAQAAPPLAVLGISRESGLVERVKAILNPAVNRRQARPRDLMYGLVLALFMLVPLGAQQAAKPVLLHRVEPQYTEEARVARIQGPVTLTTVVRTDGSFSAIKVVSGLGHGLDEKAIEAVRQWRAKPAMRDGKPIESTASVTVNFRL